jgi:hypothetical protein
MAGGTGVLNPMRFVFGFSLATMIFTLPGAIMLAGLRIRLVSRGVSALIGDTEVIAFGALSGGAILSIANLTLPNFATGALYGGMTALAFVCLYRAFAKANFHGAQSV